MGFKVLIHGILDIQIVSSSTNTAMRMGPGRMAGTLSQTSGVATNTAMRMGPGRMAAALNQVSIYPVTAVMRSGPGRMAAALNQVSIHPVTAVMRSGPGRMAIAAQETTPSSDLQDLLDALETAATDAGGSGIGNWFVFVGDEGLTNQGSLGGNLTAHNSPTTNSSFSNGRTSYVFNGSSQYLEENSGFHSGDVWTAFFVGRSDTISGIHTLMRANNYNGSNSYTERLWGAYSDDNELGFTAPNSPGGFAFSESTFSASSIFRLTGIWRSNNTLRAWVNDVSGTNWGSVDASAPTAQFIRIAANSLESGPADYWDGDIAFVGLCNLSLGQTHIDNVESALDTYYGL